MEYRNVYKATFVARLNRFVADVLLEGEKISVHVKNTGRCKELLQPGSLVYLSDSENNARRYRYDLIAVEKKTERGVILVNMDSQAPNLAVKEWLPSSGLFSTKARIRPETFFGNSRFDFYVEDGNRRAFIEVKGVTLEKDGIARFPDAPILRGVKHLEELISAKKEGFQAYVLFLIQMKGVHSFEPNTATDPNFEKALRNARREGVGILCYDSLVTPSSLIPDHPVPVSLGQ